MKKWFEKLTTAGILETDSEELAMWKRLIAGATFFGILNLPAFGIVLWLFEAKYTALGMFAYALVNAVTLPIFLLTKKYHWYRNLHMALLAIGPAVYTITMGGVLASGILLIWCMWMPAAGLASGPRRSAASWAIFAAVTIILTSVLVQFTPTFDHPPVVLSQIIGTMNLVSVGTFLYMILNNFVAQRDSSRAQLAAEKERSEELLLNVLPKSIATRLQAGETVIADRFNGVTILFADMVGFTPLSERTNAESVVAWLNDLFTRFDQLVEARGIEKIRTIGDAYMAVSGAPISRDDHAEVMVALALEMAAELNVFCSENELDISFRIGINSGSAIGAIIGTSKFHYDVWGKAVNLAARMESHSLPGRIQITAQTKDLLNGKYELESRGPINVKGMGMLETWFVKANA
jgi:adenylate cyclase